MSRSKQPDWRSEIRAFRVLIQGLESPMPDLLAAFEQAETIISTLEIDLALTDFSPFEALPAAPAPGREQPVRHNATRDSDPIQADQWPMPSVMPNLPQSPLVQSSRPGLESAQPLSRVSKISTESPLYSLLPNPDPPIPASDKFVAPRVASIERQDAHQMAERPLAIFPVTTQKLSSQAAKWI